MANNMPVEVLDQICHYLSHEDLKSVRHMCRIFNMSARRLLFHTVNVHCDLESLRKYAIISKTPSLRNLINEICVVGRYYPRLSLEKWKDAAKSSMHASYVDSSKVDEFWRSLLDPEIAWHYSQHCYQAESVRAVWKDEKILNWLVNASRDLPYLESIACIVHENDEIPEFDRPFQYNRLSDRLKRSLLKPEFRIDDHQQARLFQALFNVTAENNRALKAVKVENIACNAFSKLNEICDSSPIAKTSSIRRLVLSMSSPTDDPRTTTLQHEVHYDDIFAFISRHLMLQKLHLDFELLRHRPSTRANVGPRPSLDKLLLLRLHWPSLRDLRLAGLKTKCNTLIDFLQTHSSNLRRLELANVQLGRPSRMHRPQLPESDSWVAVIISLSANLQLDHISLDGSLEGWVDSWLVKTFARPGSAPRMIEPCIDLRDRVHAFILRGGDCPLSLECWHARHPSDPSWSPTECLVSA